MIMAPGSPEPGKCPGTAGVRLAGGRPAHSGSPARSRLRVASKHADQLSEDIYAGRGHYWWSWAEPISPLTDPAAAAAKVARVLHAAP
jgi:hypothetical protein